MLENFIEDINVENEMNKQTAERLKSSLDDTRAILENAIQEYRKEISDHRKILKRQNNYIDVCILIYLFILHVINIIYYC